MDRLSPLSTSASVESSSPASEAPTLENNAEALMNLSLLDPPRWGWSAAGGVVDLLPPHERARRKETKDAYLEELKRQEKMKRKTKKPLARPAWGSPTNSQLRSPSQIDASLQIPQNNTMARMNRNVGASSAASKNGESSVSALSRNETNDKEISKNSVGNLGAEKKVNPASPPNLLAVGDSNATSQILKAETESVGPLSNQVPSKQALPDSPEKVLNEINVSDSLDAKVSGSTEGFSCDKSENNKADEGNSLIKNKKKDKNIFEVQALSEAGILDMYSYHRGREGLEPRDENTGDLLCDVCETDTNHKWDKPRMIVAVNVSFPISDNSDANDGNEIECKATTQQRKGKKQQIPYFRETIEWDLSDPSTPTATTFASNVALEFGLEYGQTMDLAASVQKQIDDFVKCNITYDPPIALTDPYGNGRESGKLVPPGFGSTPTLYGKFNCSGRPGLRRVAPGGRSRAKSGTPLSRRSSSKSVSCDPVPAHLLPKHDGPTPVTAKSGRSSGKSYNFEIEKEYRDEVLKRVKAASIKDIRQKAGDGLVGLVSRQSNHVCHICHARKPHCGVFSCGMASHSLCEFHCTTRLGFSIVKPDRVPLVMEHCPICSLECVCPKCCRRLDYVAGVLKSESEEKGTKVEDTEMGDILKLCTGNTRVGTSCVRPPAKPAKDVGKRESSGRASVRESSASVVERERNKPTKKAAKVDIEKPVLVKKVPISEFPREVSGGRDLDSSFADDYRTMFTDKGNFLMTDKSRNTNASKDTKTANASKESPATDESTEDASVEVEEDGNVDYCHTCRKHGNLLCCDCCPRAFHRECVDCSEIPDNDWECHVCKKEKAGLPEDAVDGKKSMDAISATLVEYNFSDGFVASAQILSMIHEMVLTLMDYEFGELFRVPVDCNAVQGYKALVKHPMDLGSIAAKLMNGVYAKRFHSRKSWDDVLIAVLKDIELVWHNCFTFNFEGSAIYRMAEVHRRRSINIQKKSFYDLLSDNVKNCVKDYVAARRKERGVTVAPASFSTSSDKALTASEAGQNMKKTKSRHKFSVPASSGGASRQVAVFDPCTGMLVKVYSSMKGAGQAAVCLSESGHKSEYTPITDVLVNSIIRKSSKDPSILLFGYRWLYLDDLRDRKVKYAKKQALADSRKNNIRKSRKSSSTFVEMMDDGNKFVFISIEEALSNPWLADGPVGELKRLLLMRPPGESFSFMGRSWRTLLPKRGSKQNSGKEVNTSNVAISLNPVLINGLPSTNGCFRQDMLEQSLPPDVTFVKEDAISGRKLLGFQTIIGAHKDWLVTRESSPGFPKHVPNDLDYFKSNYLDNTLNIDGVFWKTIPGLSFQPLKAQSATDLTAHTAKLSTLNDNSKGNAPVASTSNGTDFAQNCQDRLSGTTCITSGSNLAGFKMKGPPSSAQRQMTIAALYSKKSVGLIRKKHTSQSTASTDDRDVGTPKWETERIHTIGKVNSEDQDQTGTKRTRNDDVTIDGDVRVTKKMAVTSA